MDTSVLTADGSSTVFPITNTGGSYWNSIRRPATATTGRPSGPRSTAPTCASRTTSRASTATSRPASARTRRSARASRSATPGRASRASWRAASTSATPVRQPRPNSPAATSPRRPSTSSPTTSSASTASPSSSAVKSPTPASRASPSRNCAPSTARRSRTGRKSADPTVTSSRSAAPRVGHRYRVPQQRLRRPERAHQPRAALRPEPAAPAGHRAGRQRHRVHRAGVRRGRRRHAAHRPRNRRHPLRVREEPRRTGLPALRDLHAYTWEGTSRKEAAFTNFLLSDFGQEVFVSGNNYFQLPADRLATQREGRRVELRVSSTGPRTDATLSATTNRP